MSWLSRLMNAFRPDRLDRELEEELRFHLEARAEEAIRRGMNPQDAAREARLRLGNELHTRETSRDARLMPWLESLLKDARFGFRMLRKDSAVTAAALASLALAIGASLAAFALVDALLLRPLPVYQPERLIQLTTPDEINGWAGPTLSYPLFDRCRQASRAQLDLFGMSIQSLERVVFAKSGGREESLRVQYASGNALPSLGVRPALGRLLTPNDDLRPGAHPVAVASYNFWMRRFGGEPSALGQWFSVGTKQFQIVGVTEKGFTGTEPGIRTDLWVPAMMWWSDEDLANPGSTFLRVLGRLKPGVTIEAARPALQTVYTRFLREQAVAEFRPDTPRVTVDRFLRSRLDLRPAPNGPSELRETFARPLWILAVVAGLLLLIACSNLTNLFTARALAREREMALRISIGAGRGRLMRQLLVEGALLACAASVLAAAFAAIAAPAIVSLLSTTDSPAYLDLHPDWRMLAFLLLACTAATLLFALLPALRASGVSPHEALKSGGRQPGRAGALRPMVAAQIAFSFVVLFVAGLLLLSFRQLTHVDLGFRKNGVVLIGVETTDPDPFAKIYYTPAARLTALQLVDRVLEVPGVRNAAMCEFGFFSGTLMDENVRIPGRAPGDEGVYGVPVSPGFLETTGVRLLEGRTLAPSDFTPTPSVVLVNQAFARRNYPGEDPVGKRFVFSQRDRDLPQDIVGVVQDVRLQSVRQPAPPTVFVPLRGLNGTLAVRADGDPWKVVPLVRRQIRDFGHSVRDGGVTLQSALVDDDLVRERLLALLAGFFALAALALAGVGLYGVLSYSVVRRTKEIGIRMALGARQASVVRLVIREITVAAAIGLAAGLVLGRLLARPVESLLYEVRPGDFWSLALPLALLLAAAALAAFRPALRADKVDPAIALRNE